jgi:hypothetical protein
MTADLRAVLHEELDGLITPPGDLYEVRTAGNRLRRRRKAAVGAAAVLGVAVLVAGFALGGSDAPSSERGVDPIGRLDLSAGLRAYAAPGDEIHLGGRTFPSGRLEFLDTDAAATPYGVVFYDEGRPMLLDGSGDITRLEPGAEKSRFRPTAKVDSRAPLVAYGATRDGDTEVVVRDLASGEVVARHPVPASTTIDGLDGGAVFLRTEKGTSVWGVEGDDERVLAGPQTHVADVRNGVVLYDGPAPTGPAAAAYRLVPGAIDAQLTYDGRHILSWSNRLESTDGGQPVVLDQQATFFAVDTDGSILAARPGPGATNSVYDCEVPSGRCTGLGSLTTLHGDPMFIGVDM